MGIRNILALRGGKGVYNASIYTTMILQILDVYWYNYERENTSQSERRDNKFHV